jgi:putative nucleotide binding protein
MEAEDTRVEQEYPRRRYDDRRHERRREIDKSKMEDYAYIIDFMPYGHPDDKRPIHRREPLAQVVGEKRFTLLEVSIKKGENPLVMDRVFIGKGERDVVYKIKKRLRYEDLTPAAKSELPYVIDYIIKQNEDRFVEIFNKAEPITTKFHQLELLPGVGKKTMWAIIDERKKEPFKSFRDLAERVKGLQHPEKLILNRILYEIKNPGTKYRIFT